MPKNPARRMSSIGWKLATLSLLVSGILLAGVRLTLASSSASGPDVTVYDLYQTSNYGVDNGIRAYSVGTESCNVGSEPLWWCDNNIPGVCDDEEHPVIAQNLYRLKNGRFEQIGMSWLKHGFLSLNNSRADCGDGTCDTPPQGGDQLGVGCTDPYGSGLNGSRPMGLRSEVNATTGNFVFPKTVVPSPSIVDQRIQVKETDLDPAANVGAQYWIEGHYVAADDALAGNGLNNASYRRVTITGSSFNLTLQDSDPTVREKAAITAWPTVDPTVTMLGFSTPTVPKGHFNIARKVTDLGGGTWHYEYAVHNMNADMPGSSFIVDFPAATVFDSIGYSGVKHHSGEPYTTIDWTPSTTGDQISWTADLTNAPDSNFLRWGTMFSFWFNANSDATGATETIGLFVASIFEDGFEAGNTSAWSANAP